MCEITPCSGWTARAGRYVSAKTTGRSTPARITAAPSPSAATALTMSCGSPTPQRKGLFYARSSDQGKTFSTPMPFGDHQAQAGHPHVLAQGENVFIVWKEFDGQRAAIYGMASQDQGSSWSKPVRVADTAGASDHPLLIGNGKRGFLSWNTAKEGWRLIDMATP